MFEVDVKNVTEEEGRGGEGRRGGGDQLGFGVLILELQGCGGPSGPLPSVGYFLLF